MGELNSDDHYIYHCGQDYLRRSRVTIIVNKSPDCNTWMQSQKRQNDLSSFPRQPFNITVIQVYAPTSNAEEAEVEQFYEDLQRTSRTNTQKDVLFHYRGLEWVNLTQMTIISTAAGRNPLEEME